ncbi:MAG: RHS repeat-associated core domain-containing protein, partial [Candidatus Electrothrix sp. ATG2]|nr:RHS repeat-associated core domain-containing protein [Candidatus Electrothrix sp. ATG2]
DVAGSVVKAISYDSFGTILSDSNPAFAVPFGFAGGLHDRDTGLVKFGFRDYDPAIGRWVAKDPIFFVSGDVDLYGYVENDPVNFIDPEGEFGLAGAFLGAGIEIAEQAYGNYRRGCDVFNVVDNYDWWDVGVSAAVGAFAPGFVQVGKKAWQARRALNAIKVLSSKSAQTANRAAKIAGEIKRNQAYVSDFIKIFGVQTVYQEAKATGKAINE